MDVEVRLVGVAVVADPGDLAPDADVGAGLHEHRALHEVSEHDPCVVAPENHVVPGHVLAVALRDGQVREVVPGPDHDARAGSHDRGAEDRVARGVGRLEALEPRAPGADGDQVHRIALATIRPVPRVRVERVDMGVDRRVGAAVGHQEHARRERERQVHHARLFDLDAPGQRVRRPGEQQDRQPGPRVDADSGRPAPGGGPCGRPDAARPDDRRDHPERRPDPQDPERQREPQPREARREQQGTEGEHVGQPAGPGGSGSDEDPCHPEGRDESLSDQRNPDLWCHAPSSNAVHRD